MDHILRSLESNQTVLDLGCGNSSFRYDLYACKVIAADQSQTIQDVLHRDSRADYVALDSCAIPLASNSIDFVICHHTLEHFSGYRTALEEIGRVLKPDGILWVAVPNGSGLDDRLYRFLFKGGGHVNRFSRQSLTDEVESLTGTHLLQQVDLFSGFVYLKRPPTDVLKHFPRRAKLFVTLPRSINLSIIFMLNIGSRLIDKVFNTRTSQYGWGFVFARQPITVESQESYFNVCWQCGSAHSLATADVGPGSRSLGLYLCKCTRCGATNALIQPPAGLA